MKDGIAVDWPIRYADIEPWYTYVEKFVGVQGKKEGLAHLPDGEFLPSFDLNCAEDHFKQAVEQAFPERTITPGRTANLTKYIPELHHGTRGQCQARNRCWRGLSLRWLLQQSVVDHPGGQRHGQFHADGR